MSSLGVTIGHSASGSGDPLGIPKCYPTQFMLRIRNYSYLKLENHKAYFDPLSIVRKWPFSKLFSCGDFIYNHSSMPLRYSEIWESPMKSGTSPTNYPPNSLTSVRGLRE